MRIDGADSADNPEDAHVARSARSTPDDPDVTGKDKSAAGSGGDLGHSFSASSDTALRTERFAAHCAKVDADYRRYDVGCGHAPVEKLEQETVAPAVRPVEVDDRKLQPVGLNDRSKGKDRPTESDDLTKTEIPARARRSREYDLIPQAPVLVHHCDLPEGYKSSPALKGDPYHPDAVSERSRANQELYAATSRDLAAALGYDKRIPAQKAPFDSHGQEVFTNGKSYITPDVDEHNVTNGWKMFSRRGARIGTYDSELNYVKE